MNVRVSMAGMEHARSPRVNPVSSADPAPSWPGATMGDRRSMRIVGPMRDGRWWRSAVAWLLFAIVATTAGCGSRASRVTSLAPPTVPGGIACDPSIALDPVTSDVLLTWLAGDSASLRVWFTRSTDDGATWSSPFAVSPPGEPLEPQGEATPRIACDAEGRIAIMWATGAEGPGGSRPASELRFIRSLDRGTTWSEVITLHEGQPDIPRTQRFHDLTSTDEGRLVAAWLVNPALGDTSHRVAGDGASIRIAVSPDFGGSWGQEAAEWSQVCPCCRVAVGTDLVGNTFAAFRRHYEDGGCDVALARPDGPPVHAHVDGWAVEACPRSGPGFEVARDGTLRVAWFTGVPGRTGVWFRQGVPERYDTTAVPVRLMATAATDPLHVSVGDAGMSGTLVACDGDTLTAGALTLFRIEASGRRVAEQLAVPGARDAVRPQVAATNKAPRAYVAWTEREGSARHLRLLRWDVGR